MVTTVALGPYWGGALSLGLLGDGVIHIGPYVGTLWERLIHTKWNIFVRAAMILCDDIQVAAFLLLSG